VDIAERTMSDERDERYLTQTGGPEVAYRSHRVRRKEAFAPEVRMRPESRTRFDPFGSYAYSRAGGGSAPAQRWLLCRASAAGLLPVVIL